MPRTTQRYEGSAGVSRAGLTARRPPLEGRPPRSRRGCRLTRYRVLQSRGGRGRALRPQTEGLQVDVDGLGRHGLADDRFPRLGGERQGGRDGAQHGHVGRLDRAGLGGQFVGVHALGVGPGRLDESVDVRRVGGQTGRDRAGVDAQGVVDEHAARLQPVHVAQTLERLEGHEQVGRARRAPAATRPCRRSGSGW